MTEPQAVQTEGRESREALDGYWHRNLRLTGGLLFVWFVVTFVASYFARELSFNFFGWPFSFWLASQGALVVYLAIVCWYARRIDRLDRECGVAEEP